LHGFFKVKNLQKYMLDSKQSFGQETAKHRRMSLKSFSKT